MLQGTAGAGRRLANALGTSRHLMTICMVAGAEGTGYVLGDNRVGMDPEGFAESKLILLWGSNPLSTGPHLWKFITAARKKGAHLVAIDPIRTRSAAQADEHLAPVPGTDAALALGLMHHVVSAGAEDRSSSPNTPGMGGVPGAHHGVPAGSGRRDHGHPRGTHPLPGRAAGLDAADRDQGGDRAAAPRRRGRGDTRDLLHPGVTGDWRYPAAARPTTPAASSPRTGPACGATTCARPAPAAST
jgi:hypothetical protein